MFTKIRHTALAMLFLTVGLQASCETPDGSFVEANNNMRLPVFGFPTEAGDVERVEVPVEFVPGTPESDGVRDLQLSVSDATLVGNATTGSSRMYLEVTNTSDRPMCFVEAEEIEFLDRDGGVLADDFGFIDGSAARTESARILIQSCLVEGETGFLASLVSDLDPTDVAEIRITVIATDARRFEPPQAELVPTSADVVDEDAESQMRVTVENRGSSPARLENVKLVLFDSDGEFLHWTFADPMGVEVAGAGGTAVVSSNARFVPGTPTEALVHLVWEE